ncbi:MAG: hypothetical protein ACE5HQ_11275, partial [Gemmatimonadota bacterium]
MPPFVDDALRWARLTGGHFAFMFWWLWVLAVGTTALSESTLVERLRRRLLERPGSGRGTILWAALLGVASPPSRRRIFRQAKELLAQDVDAAGVIAYLVAAQTLPAWTIFLILGLNGPQPVIGLAVALAAGLAVLAYGVGRMPEGLWERARRSAAEEFPGAEGRSPIAAPGPVWARPFLSVAGQAASLWWPVLFGLLGVGFFLALGQSPAAVSLQGSKGPWVQLGNAGAGLLLAYIMSAPLVGNALVAAGLW